MELITYLSNCSNDDIGTYRQFGLLQVKNNAGQFELYEMPNQFDNFCNGIYLNRSRQFKVDVLAKDNNVYGYIDSQTQNFVPIVNQNEIKSLLLEFYVNTFSHIAF